MKVPGIKYVQGRNSYSPSTKYGIAIHNTSNDAPASGEASYATRRTDGVSSHFYADGKEVIQSLDTNNRAGHAGSTNGNYNAVAVEITGVNAKSRQWWIDNVNWDQLGYALAEVCKVTGTQVRRASVAEMKSNPKVKAFYSHNDMRLAWGGTTHNDPGDNFPWDYLFAAVNKYLYPEEFDVSLSDKEYAQVVQGDLTPDNVLHFRLRALQNADDPKLEPYYKLGWDKVPGLKQVMDTNKALATEVASLKAQLATVLAKLESLQPTDGLSVGKLYVDVEKLDTQASYTALRAS